VARALDRARRLVDVPLDQLPVVVRAAVLDGEHVAVAVEDADLEILPFDETMLAGGKLFDAADVDQGAQKSDLEGRYSV
jgi:hypothetical protein